jgi:hypothetical protein
MKPQFTVVWSASARKRLAELWLDNPAIRQEITAVANEIDAALANQPASFGIATPGRARLVTRPPLTALFLVLEDDRQVRVIYVKLWDD